MKELLTQLSPTLVLTLSLIACGGGGGGGGSSSSGGGGGSTPEPETPLVPAETVESIKDSLIEGGFGNFDEFTETEIEQGMGDFDDISNTEIEIIENELSDQTNLTEEQIDFVLDELEIEEPETALAEDPTATFTTSIIGLWEGEGDNNDILLSIGSKTISIYTPNGSCYDFSLYNIYASTDNHFTVEDPLTDELSVITALGDTTITYEGLNYTSSDIATLGAAPLCESTSAKSISVDIDLAHLETELKLESTASPISNYRWQIFFDTNRSGKYDSGDMNFLLSYSSDEDSPSGSDFVDITASDAKKPQLFHVYQSDSSEVNFLTSESTASPGDSLSIGKSDDLGTLSVSGNTLTFTFTSSINPMIDYITSDTPIKVITLLIHDADDSATYGSLTTDDDGPWSWTSEQHIDYYPTDGFADSTSGVAHTDPADDQEEGEATWIDITSVTVTVTE